MNQLRLWMDAASPEEKKKLAELAGTTLGSLHQIAGAYRTDGSPSVRPKLARKIEQAAAFLAKHNRALPALLRTDLAPECRECEFAQRCLGKKAATSGFEVLEETGGG